MIAALLIALQLANAGEFLRFDRCYLDTSVWPPEFRPYKASDISITRDEQIFIRSDAILFMSEPEASIAGISCIKISTAQGGAFVQGTLEDIKRKIMEAK